MAEPKSSQANNEVTQLAQSQGIFGFWIGVNDIANEGTFVYDSSGETVVYENWNHGEPNDAGGEDCTKVNNGKWNDMPCEWALPFVCEKSGKSIIYAVQWVLVYRDKCVKIFQKIPIFDHLLTLLTSNIGIFPEKSRYSNFSGKIRENPDIRG